MHREDAPGCKERGHKSGYFTVERRVAGAVCQFQVRKRL